MDVAHEPAPARQDRSAAAGVDALAAAPGLSRRAFLGAMLAGGAATLAGCQPAGGATSAPTAGPASVGTVARPPAPAPAAAEPWQREWDSLLAAARQEGRLVFAGPPSPDLRVALPARFKERFGIEMEYLAFPPNQGEMMDRLARERAAGLVTVDAFLGGPQSIYTIAFPARITAPIKPVLIHPDALDPSKWKAGRVWYRDPEERYFVQIQNQVSGQIMVNAEHVRPDDIKSWQDLLDPRYTGKLSAWNPTVPGVGWTVANWLRLTFGDDYLKRLFVDQKMGIPGDSRQWADWLARGTYPIAVGASARDTEALRRDGFKIEVLPSFPAAPGVLTGAFGIAALLEDPPHPNAARLFTNWILTRDGQETWCRAEQAPSVRTDLDNAWAPSHVVPQPGLNYFDAYEWDFVTTAFAESVPKIRELTAVRT